MTGRLRRALSVALSGLVAAATVLHSDAAAPPRDEDLGEWVDVTAEWPWPANDIPPPSLRRASAGRIGTQIELPTRSVLEWTPAMVKAAQLAADTGRLMPAADLVESLMGDDRVQGVLSTRTHGLLGLPRQFFGDDEDVEAGDDESPKAALEGTKALADRPAVPGDWAKMLPEAELALFAAWGILLGVALAEMVPPEERDIGEREVPTMRVWHPRWLRHDWTTDTWWLTTAEGEVQITPGDGRWVLWTPYGSSRPWTKGAWRPLAFAYLLKQYALHDRTRASEVYGSAMRVGIAPDGATEEARRKQLRDLKRLGRDTALLFPSGWDVKLVEATGQTWQIYRDQIEWADRAIAIVLAGQYVTTEGTTGFSNGNIHAAIKHDLIQFTAEALATCLHEQVVKPWAERNYGSAARAPFVRWDTSPPEDKKTTAEAISALGDAITKLDQALSPSGRRVNAVELCSKFGVPLVELAPPAVKPSAPLPPLPELKPAAPLPALPEAA